MNDHLGTTGQGLADRVARAALDLGFSRVGFARAERLDDDGGRLSAWIAAGRHGELAYLAGADRADPGALLGGARTVVVVAMAHGEADTIPLRVGRDGRVARYARGADYHDVMLDRLRRLCTECAEIVGRPVAARPAVDMSPLLERAFAVRAGIGFASKSTMVIAPGLGSYVLLGELLLDVEIEPSTPLLPRCGSCRACLDACPTGAFVDANVLDARRCISYLTIELTGPIPSDLRPLIGDRIFGCDVCQEVCPFNGAAGRERAPELAPLAGTATLDLVETLQRSNREHRRLTRGTALRRVSRNRLARNAAVALGNVGGDAAVDALASALASHPSALVRGHAAWALGSIGGSRARFALESSAADADESVRAEVRAALERSGSPARPAHD